MEVLINAGGKGTRMGDQGTEKPMLPIGGKPVIGRVVDAMEAAGCIDRILVSVSPNTPETERYLRGRGVEVVRTSGEDFMMDMRESFSLLRGDYVAVCPSDMPLLTAGTVDRCISEFEPSMQSMVVMVRSDIVRRLGVSPSYECDVDGTPYVLSGLSVMDRRATLRGDYLDEHRLLTDIEELAVNVNTPRELMHAREMCSLRGLVRGLGGFRRLLRRLLGGGLLRRLLRRALLGGGLLRGLLLDGDREDLSDAAVGIL